TRELVALSVEHLKIGVYAAFVAERRQAIAAPKGLDQELLLGTLLAIFFVIGKSIGDLLKCSLDGLAVIGQRFPLLCFGQSKILAKLARVEKRQYSGGRDALVACSAAEQVSQCAALHPEQTGERDLGEKLRFRRSNLRIGSHERLLCLPDIGTPLEKIRRKTSR